MRKKLESRVGSIFTFSSRFAKKSKSPKTPPKKSESSPTAHVTETRFLHVLDPPDHFGTIYIFDDFFTFGLSFFSTNFPEKSQSPELAAYSHSAADSPKNFQQIFPKKVRVQSWQHIHIQQQIRQKSLSPKTPPKKLESSPTTHVTETRFLHVLDPPDHFGTIYIFDDFFTFGLSFFSTNFPEKS